VLSLDLSAADAASAAPPGGTPVASQSVVFHGVRLVVPNSWEVVDLVAQPHACVRYDRPALYLGHTGDQSDCPSHLLGGAPAFQLEPLDEQALGPGNPTLTVAPAADIAVVPLPRTGPARVAIEGAGVLLSAAYGAASAPAVTQILSTASLTSDAVPTLVNSLPAGQAAPAVGANVPGNYRGEGFDACAAPSQAAMDGWRNLSDYRSVGIYIGGVNRGCSQANLNSTWVSRQVGNGWHVVPTYVGLQAPCTSFRNRLSYGVTTARVQGRSDGADAVAKAQALGIAAPSTLYSDMEGYDSSNSSCVAAVMSYLTGWTYALHRYGFEAGVYSSASSGIHDLSTHYDSFGDNRPDEIWIAWWNYRADVDGGSYVPDSQWRDHQRLHQFVGNSSESYAGYSIQIDRNFLDVSTSVRPPRGCPTNLNFKSYPMLQWPDHGVLVVAAQCLLARAGFDPGAATGTLGWRTAAAIRAFKASRGLDSDDAAIRRWAWTALASAGPTQFLQIGSHGSRVRKVQRALTAHLQRTVAISGKYDVATRNAVLSYQKSLGMTPTGTVGVPTWRALQSGI